MNQIRLVFILIFIFFIGKLTLKAQNEGQNINGLQKKSLTAKRTEVAPKIDGFVKDAVWLQAEVATDFVQLSPNPLEKSAYKTEVRFLYDDQAVYVSFMCFDESGDVVLRQLSERDNIGNSDWVGIFINSYQDGLNGEGFRVSAAGVQSDTKFSNDNDDDSWNAVWDSEVQILDNGWSVEFKIPYAALRFPDKAEQTWNINFVRSVRRSREESWWDDIDPKIDGYFNQFGTLKGIKNIKPPLRLFLYPYVSANAEHFPFNEEGLSNWSQGFNAGLDLKYGINDAFTLDMTLIPDFGQVRSDNQVLNLSPFEVQFSENRQFFTEGTALFNKGNLFYSRRIGATPTGFYDIEDSIDSNETIISNPSITQLINSTKISGRTASGLGIGFFNSVTNSMDATIKHDNGDQRQVQTEPLTNYNIMVLDQTFRNNSFVTLINTNVQRFGTKDDANVTSALFQLNDKTNTYSSFGKFAYSYKIDENGQAKTGFQSFAELAKISGNFQYGVSNRTLSDTYDHNDLGFLNRNNMIDNEAYASYNIFKPVGIFNRMRFNLNTNLTYRYNNQAFQDFSLNYNSFFVTKSFFAFGINARLEPVVTYDFFEPRVEGRYLEYPTNRNINAWFSSDYRKKLALDMRVSYRAFDQEGRNRQYISVEPRFRVNDKLSFIYETTISNNQNNLGTVNILDEAEDSIIIGRRDLMTVVNQLYAKYIFNNKMGITFRARHYWSKANYNNYYLLSQEGTLDPSNYDGLDEGESAHDISYNAFNIDCIFNWQFGPGSFMTVVWKNAIFNSTSLVDEKFSENFINTFDADQNNNFSIRVIYFLDYLSLKKK